MESLLTGFAGEAGVFLSERLAIGGEVRRPFQHVDIDSDWRYLETSEHTESQYRETAAFGTVRGVWRVGSRARAGVVGGGGVLIGHSSEVVTRTRTTTGTIEQHARDVSATFFGTMFGGEFAVALNRYVSIVPDARLYIVNRIDESNLTNPGVYLGLPSRLFQTQIGVRIGR